MKSILFSFLIAITITPVKSIADCSFTNSKVVFTGFAYINPNTNQTPTGVAYTNLFDIYFRASEYNDRQYSMISEGSYPTQYQLKIVGARALAQCSQKIISLKESDPSGNYFCYPKYFAYTDQDTGVTYSRAAIRQIAVKQDYVCN